MLCIHFYETLASTNDEAIRLAKEGAPEGTVVWAESQTSGRGRRGRQWESPQGNIYMSVLVRPQMPFSLAGRLSVASGLMVSRLFDGDVRTKWPNDLYCEGKKVGGILVETRTAPGGMLEWAVVGLGLNVVSHPDVEPPAQPAGRLSERWRETIHWDPGFWVQSIAAAVLQGCGVYAANEVMWTACRTVLWPQEDLANGPIRVLEGERVYEAVGAGLDSDAALLVRVGEEVSRVTSGEVSIRPA